MRRNQWLRAMLGFAALQVVTAGAAWAQFQSCNYCDVMAFTPDPLPVRPCDTGTIVINGVGYSDRFQNGCSATPDVVVRSTRPDRITITAWRVRSDNQIEFDYTVPCNASPGLTGIDVTIDDNPGDAIVPYACGNNRMIVEPLVLSVTYDLVTATRARAGVEVAWSTLSEYRTLGFQVWARRANGSREAVGNPVVAHGAGTPYVYVDSSPEAWERVSYQVVEINDDGVAGDSSPWVTARSTASGQPRRR